MSIDVNEEAWNHVCSDHYSFDVQEDIYARFRFPFPMIPAGSKIVIYGGGIVGKIFLRQIQQSSYCMVRAICDQAPARTGIVEAPLIDLATLAGIPSKEYDVVLIAIERRDVAKEIRENLIMAGIKPKKIRWVDPRVHPEVPLGAVTQPVEQVHRTASHPARDFEFEADTRFGFPFSEVEKGSRVVIYGGGIVGKTFLVQALSDDYIQLLAVCDRKPAQTGIESLPVITPTQLADLPEDSYDLVLIAIEKELLAEDINDTLIGLGISEEKIKWVNPKV
ncbi:hypothetical protein [uncultured Selenomonas sp.]|uniref:hypothetical protein n=1 Tax=uncultured Selenomonas sp. TaxID=159275 RepID=UPI0025F3408D|nr:hypothetical protein [uncultured Selenomonas sp.]